MKQGCDLFQRVQSHQFGAFIDSGFYMGRTTGFNRKNGLVHQSNRKTTRFTDIDPVWCNEFMSFALDYSGKVLALPFFALPLLIATR